MAERLTFDEKWHTYYLDGNRVPSVTSIMKPINDSHYKDINEEVLRKAAEKGTAVHEAIEFFLKYGAKEIDKQYKGYFDAYLKWHEKVKPETIASEFRTYNESLLYAGTADYICRIDGEVWLIDFKTVVTVNNDNYRVQTEAYKKALEGMGIEVKHKMILQIKSDGTYKEYVHPDDDKSAWSLFKALRLVYSFNKDGL